MDGQYNNQNCNNRPTVRLNTNSNPYPYPHTNSGNCPQPAQQQYPYRARQFRLTSNPAYYACDSGHNNRMPQPAVIKVVVPNRNSYSPRPATPPAMAKPALKPYISERCMPPPCVCPPGRRTESEPSIQTLPTCSSHTQESSSSALSRQTICSNEQIIEEPEGSECPAPAQPVLPPPPPTCSPQRRASSPRQSPCPSPQRRSSETDCEQGIENLAVDSTGSCTFPQHDMQHLKQQLLKYRGEMQRCSDTAKINAQLNEIFLRRVFDVEHKAGGDVDILLSTYQEWVDMLLQINEVFINNMEDLESEVAERLEMMKCRIKDECKKSEDDVTKYKKDICTLLKFIQKAYHYNNWNVCGLQFQTISPTDLLGTQQIESESDNQNRCAEQTMGLPRSCSGADTLNAVASYSSGQYSCEQQDSEQQMKSYLHALAVEVASKHDEICDLKRQICCLEDEIQKAQQKIQLKDDVIKELRSEVKSANAKLSTQSVTTTYTCAEASYYNNNMPPINLPPINLDVSTSSRSATTQVSVDADAYKALPYYNDDCSQFDALSQTTNHLQQEKLVLLEAELNELFAVAQSCKKQNLECHRKRLSDIFQKSEREKADAYRKLDYIRRQLVDLEASGDECNGCKNEDSDSGFSSKCENDQDAKIINSVRKRLRCLNDKLFELKTCMQQLKIENNELSTCLNTEKRFAKCNGETLKELADLLCSIRGEQFSYEEIYTNSKCQPNPFCGAVMQMKCEMENEQQRLLNALVERDKQLEELEGQLCNQHGEELNSNQLETNQMNADLQCQVEELQRNISEKEQNITQLNSVVERLQCQLKHNAECCRHTNNQELQEMSLKLEQSQRRAETLVRQLEHSQRQEHFLLSETRKLNEELNASRRKHDDLSVQVHRLALLLKKQESCRSNICTKYEELESSYEEQARQLRAACMQMNSLQERLTVMDNRQEEHKMERTLLREEVLALKDKETHMLSLHKNLSERLLKTEKELYSAHDVIKEQQAIMQRNECTQRENVNRLREANNDLRKQLNAICDDYKRLEQEFKKQCDVRKQNEKVIESFRKWKEAQLKADDSTRASFKQYEDHIKSLLEEKQKFLQQYRQLHHDHCMLQTELDRLKTRTSNCSLPGYSLPNSSLNQRMELLRNTTRRLSEQCDTLRSDDTSQAASGSKLQQNLR